jgi:putative ABC transport system permease protein
MRLALQNILHDRARFSATVLGVSFAAFLMLFQGSLLIGFLQASSRFIDASGFDIWITARGVQAFEFGAPLRADLRDLAAGVPGVVETARACMAFAVYRKPNGKQQVVALVGADPNIGNDFPIPESVEPRNQLTPESVVYDTSDRAVLETVSLPAQVEINGRRANIDREIRGFGGFLGVPTLFTSYNRATELLGYGPESGMYILARVGKQYSVSDVQENLKQRLPEVDVLTRGEFGRKSRWYWVVKTGAGSAILTAALLGFVIGLVVVSQTIYANTMEHIEEYATLKAIGAPRSFIARILVMESLICGLVGSIVGLVIVIPTAQYAKNLIPWIHTPWWLPLITVGISLVMCSLASFASVRRSLSVDPGRVFRA